MRIGREIRCLPYMRDFYISHNYNVYFIKHYIYIMTIIVVLKKLQFAFISLCCDKCWSFLNEKNVFDTWKTIKQIASHRKSIAFVSQNFRVYILSIYYLYTIYILSIPSSIYYLYTIYILSIYYLYIIYILFVYQLCIIFILSIYYLHTIYILSLYNLCTIYILSKSKLYPIYILSIYFLHSIHILSIYFLYTTYILDDLFTPSRISWHDLIFFEISPNFF